ncbi:type I restriction-modification system subunit M [Candidatus Dependentiae bacterium]|nr:type I restriction-modification system subunit M [Candidatus Dependentiae bacterium]
MSDSPKVTQNEINNLAWKACDTFRGVINADQYKDYILVFLFIKYISDVWKEHYQQYSEMYKGDEVRIQRRLERERFFLPKESTFDYIYMNRTKDNIGEIINTALEQIEEKNKEKLEGVFRSIDFNSENLGKTKDRNKRLKNLIEDFADSKLDFRSSHTGNQDIIGNVYEYLISRFASDSGKKGGEFYTPPEVAQLLAKVLGPKSGMKICDPTCGSGSLLIKIADEIQDGNYSLYGQESNGSTWALCKMNMFLHSKDTARIEWGDTLNTPLLIENDELMKFDIVVANPPFSLDKWGAENAAADKYNRFHRGVPPKNKGDYAFICHMIETALTKKGKVGVVVPHGVLFRGGQEGVIRKSLITENFLETVIGLPENIFYGTGIPTAILIFNKAKKNNDILFIDASNEYAKEKTQNKLRQEDIKKIVETCRKRQTIDKYSYLASIDEITENEFNLNIPRYVDTFEEEEQIDIPAAQKEISGLEKELAEVRQQMNGYLKELGF